MKLATTISTLHGGMLLQLRVVLSSLLPSIGRTIPSFYRRIDPSSESDLMGLSLLLRIDQLESHLQGTGGCSTPEDSNHALITAITYEFAQMQMDPLIDTSR